MFHNTVVNAECRPKKERNNISQFRMRAHARTTPLAQHYFERVDVVIGARLAHAQRRFALEHIAVIAGRVARDAELCPRRQGKIQKERERETATR